MTDEILKLKIKKLAKLSEENVLLGNELSGYMTDSTRRKIFRESATHVVVPKKKYSYIDQKINGSDSGGSGKFLVQTSGADAGHVFGIKAYGQKGHHVGHIDQAISKVEKDNQSLIKGVMERARKNGR